MQNDQPESANKKSKLEIGATGSVAVVKHETRVASFSSISTSGQFHHSLVGKARTKSATAIASAMFQHTTYPTIDEYKHGVK